MSAPHFLPADYLDLKQTDHASLFHGVTQAWEILPKLAQYLEEHIVPANFGRTIGDPAIGKNVYIGRGTVVEPGAFIKGPAWIGSNCQIRKGAYIRENVIIGADSVIGNSSEIKNSFLCNGCQVPHFNYVGDSILGAKVHLAAGVIVSNLKLNGDFINIQVAEDPDYGSAQVRRTHRRWSRSGLQCRDQSGIDYWPQLAHLSQHCMAGNPACEFDREGRRSRISNDVAKKKGGPSRGRLHSHLRGII